MERDSRYDILFEPVKIGPVVAKNRFFQVPHCNGTGHRFPRTQAAMRAMKAEGGWAVINTDWCSMHPSSDITPSNSARLWTDEDVRTNALMTDAVHEFGSLAGCELGHAGMLAQNRYSRVHTIGPVARPISPLGFPGQARQMDKSDIAAVRRWHRNGVRRAVAAGFDIVYIYAGHGLTIFTDFLSPSLNQRTDEYGGSIENRARMLRETLEDVIEAAAGECAIAIRFCVDDQQGERSLSAEDGKAVVEMLAEMPDLWDVTAGGLYDMLGSRFRKEGWQESAVEFVKKTTSKPVVGVGRFTSPDTMVSMVKRGVLDFIGAARPSIADPFLPNKIEEGRLDDIRECIGCNICLASHSLSVPTRCTQNPTVSEEWRREWHPEKLPESGSNARVLVVGSGPSGLEAARAAAARGYNVAIAEAGKELGGHLNAFMRLPGHAEWSRVVDWRVGQIRKMTNVEVFMDSDITVSHVEELGYEHVIVATGAHWRNDGVGAHNVKPLIRHDGANILTPDEVLAGDSISSPVVIFDDDSYVTGGAIAELLAEAGHSVTIVTPFAQLSPWTQFTIDQPLIHQRLLDSGVEVILNSNCAEIGDNAVTIESVFNGQRRELPMATTVLVTMRTPNDQLLQELKRAKEEGRLTALSSVTGIGDCVAPGLVSEAVFSGHEAARNLDCGDVPDLRFKVEQVPADYDPPL